MRADIYRSGFIRAAVLIALVGLVRSAEAQVVIEERVELGAASQQAPGDPAASSGGIYPLIAPEDGILRVEYGIVTRSAIPYPDSVALRVRINGTPVVKDSVFAAGRTWNQTTFIRFCQGTPYTEYYYTATDTLEVDAVVQGDTLDFEFVTDRGVFGDASDERWFTLRPDGRWDVDLFDFDAFCQQVTDRLQVIAWVGPCSESGRSPLCTIPVVKFLDQGNTALTDTVMTVSRMRTDVDLDSTSTFAGPNLPDPDPHTYRLEVEGFEAGLDTLVTFEVEVTDLADSTRTYTYRSVEDYRVVNGDTVAVYRADQHFRLVSNGIPAVGADPNGQYDDEYNDGGGGLEDQTLLVKLGYRVRGVAEDTSGTVIYTDNFWVGRTGGCTGVWETICATYVQFHSYGTLTVVNKAVSVKKASEDWAQGNVQFELSGPGDSFTPVRNVLQIEGSTSAKTGGTVFLRVVSGSDTTNVPVSILGQDTTETIAQKIAQAISDSTSLTTYYHKHNPDFNLPGDYPWLVLVNRSHEVEFLDISPPNGTIVAPANLNFYPAPGDSLNIISLHTLALNFSDGDSVNVDVYVVPDSSLGDTIQVAGKSFSYTVDDLMPTLGNSIFAEERVVDVADSTRPFTFGHELGHILALRHDTDQYNLMFGDCIGSVCGTSPVESWDATKRLRQGQIDTVRTRRGPNSANPLLQNPPNPPPAPFILSGRQREDQQRREAATDPRSRTAHRFDRPYRERRRP